MPDCWLNAWARLSSNDLNKWSCGSSLRMTEPSSFIRVLDLLILVGNEITGTSPGILCMNDASVFRCKFNPVLAQTRRGLQRGSLARIIFVAAVESVTQKTRHPSSKKFQRPVFIAYRSFRGEIIGGGGWCNSPRWGRSGCGNLARS